jgi:hypothetical protein
MEFIKSERPQRANLKHEFRNFLPGVVLGLLDQVRYDRPRLRNDG